MSAKSWALCPQCIKLALADQETRQRAARESYGKVSPDDFLKATNAAMAPPKLEESLREDWHIGVTHGGVFTVGYACSCSK